MVYSQQVTKVRLFTRGGGGAEAQTGPALGPIWTRAASDRAKQSCRLSCNGALSGQIIIVHTSWASKWVFAIMMFVNYEAQDPGWLQWGEEGGEQEKKVPNQEK